MNMYSLKLTNAMGHSNEHVKCKNYAQRKVTLPSVVGQPLTLYWKPYMESKTETSFFA